MVLAASPSLNACMTGIPPPTLASKPRSTPVRKAAANISSPCNASKALLAVTTCLPAAMDSRIMRLATSQPPINSTTMSIDGSVRICFASAVRRPGGRVRPRSRITSRSAIRTISIGTPTRRLIKAAFPKRIFATPVPTVPNPRMRTPTREIRLLPPQASGACECRGRLALCRFHFGQGSDRLAITATKAHAPTRHVVGLGEGIELDADILGLGNLQKARRLISVEHQVGIGEVMNDNHIMFFGKGYDLLKKPEIHHGGCGIMRKIDDQDLGSRKGLAIDPL